MWTFSRCCSHEIGFILHYKNKQHNIVLLYRSFADDMLAYQDLTIETLQQMYELTQFEALVPRFTATVPPCWTEIQQEQQQRRHPQHLQQQGEATQHTRTWKLQHDK